MNAKAILRVTLPYLLVWLAFMVLLTLLGQPEVICATPFGLILALVAGIGVAVVGVEFPQQFKRRLTCSNQD